jgi:hypothetical protein
MIRPVTRNTVHFTYHMIRENITYRACIDAYFLVHRHAARTDEETSAPSAEWAAAGFSGDLLSACLVSNFVLSLAGSG